MVYVRAYRRGDSEVREHTRSGDKRRKGRGKPRALTFRDYVRSGRLARHAAYGLAAAEAADLVATPLLLSHYPDAPEQATEWMKQALMAKLVRSI